MLVSDIKNNRGTHGDSSFMLGGMPSSSENPPDFSRRECQVTQRTDKLKKLIAEHPDYPIVVLAGQEASAGDWFYWTYCSDIRFDVGEILTAEAECNEEIIYTDREKFKEELEEWLWDSLDDGENPSPSEEEFQTLFEERLAQYEPFWKNVIAIYADN